MTKEDMNEIRKMFQGVNTRLDSMGERMGGLEKRLDKLEHRMDKLEERMTKLEERIARLERCFDNLEKQFSAIQTTLENTRISMKEGFLGVGEAMTTYSRANDRDHIEYEEKFKLLQQSWGVSLKQS